MPGFTKYFDREYYRKIEKRFEISPIIYCWWFNFAVAIVVFMTAWFMTLDPIMTVFYTMSAWTVTLTISIIYWLAWIQKKIKKDNGVRIVASSAVIIMFLIALIFLLRTFAMLKEVTLYFV